MPTSRRTRRSDAPLLNVGWLQRVGAGCEFAVKEALFARLRSNVVPGCEHSPQSQSFTEIACDRSSFIHKPQNENGVYARTRACRFAHMGE